MLVPYQFTAASWSLFASAAFVVTVALYALRQHAVSLFQARPDLLLIQVDVCTHGMLVLSAAAWPNPPPMTWCN